MIPFNISLLVACAVSASVSFLPLSASASENKVLGTWRIVKAVVNPETDNLLPYGPQPQGLLVFTPDMHFIEVLNDPRVPKFAINARDKGTPAENQAAMAGAIGFYGTYTVDEHGEFTGNTVLGSTFPNWIGDVRKTDRLQLTVDGDTMRETFVRPSGQRILIEWKRVSLDQGFPSSTPATRIA